MSYIEELEQQKERINKRKCLTHKMNKEEISEYVNYDYNAEIITTEEERAMEDDYKKYIVWLKSL